MAPWSSKLPQELEHEFAEMQATVPSPSPILGLLLLAVLFHAVLITERSMLRLSPHMYLMRGGPLTLIMLAVLLLPARLRQEDTGSAALAVILPLVTLALAAGIHFPTGGSVLMVESAIALFTLLSGLLFYMPRRWAVAMVLGSLAANAEVLFSGPALHAVGLPMVLQSLWAPILSTVTVLLVAWTRQNQARRDFLLLRQAVFSNAPGRTVSIAETKHLDPETGIANRLAFDMRFRAAWDHAAGRRHSVALLLFSIDNFAEQKQQHGSVFGDLLQTNVANCLRDSLRRADDMVARFDNQHFVVMLPGVGTDGVTQIAERLRGMVEDMSVFSDQKRHRVTVTVGAASLRAKRGTPREKLVDGTIQALDQARASGMNLVCVEGRGCIPAMS